MKLGHGHCLSYHPTCCRTWQVSKSRCVAAALVAGKQEGTSGGSSLEEGSWGHAPPGCFVRTRTKANTGTIDPHFSTGTGTNDGQFQLVCERAGAAAATAAAVTPSAPTSTYFVPLCAANHTGPSARAYYHSVRCPLSAYLSIGDLPQPLAATKRVCACVRVHVVPNHAPACRTGDRHR